MKLQINRREEKKGLIFKKPVYFIDVNLEVTPEEAALIKKHKWDSIVMAKGQVRHDFAIDWTVKNMIRSNAYQFGEIEWAADFENQVIESARKLKANLEGAAGFTGSGPQEIEL
jgi:hypothetical protein